MEIKILAFGQIADILGKSSLTFSDVKNTDSLIANLSEAFPELSSLKYSIAVNQKLMHTNSELNDNDTVALLPPFSGG
jgi:molybdopterin synthase sulfur carrier subunit